MGESHLRVALRWLAHPVSLVAIAVMVLNDHVLKQAYGTWWTGKLSDVAGLVFFPALVAVGLAAARPTRDGTRGAHGGFERLTFGAVSITAVAFAWVKGTAAGAAAASAVLSGITVPLFGWPSVVRADATDLLALPAVGLAAWVASRVASRAAHRVASRAGTRGGQSTEEVARPSAGRRAFAVAMVPVAILASVATTSPSYPTAWVADDGDHGWVVLAGNGGSSAYRLTAGGWEPAPTPKDPFADASKACSRTQPDWCFRTVPGQLAVEQSSDGGATWETAWAASADDRRAMADTYGLGQHSSSVLVSSGVGVFDGPDGFTVVVGNSYDGLLVRGIDGDWERKGFEGLDCCGSEGAIPLPSRWSPYGAAIPPAIAWALAAFTVLSAASLVMAHGRIRSWRSRGVTSRENTAHFLVWAGVVAAAAAAIGVGPSGKSGDGAMYVQVRHTLFVVELALAFVLAAAAFSLARGRFLRGRGQLTSFSLVVSLLAGVLVFAVPGAGWWDTVVALSVCTAAVWVASARIASDAERWGVISLNQRVKPTHAERGALMAEVATTMAAMAAPTAQSTEALAPATWTPRDALLLTCIGPDVAAADVRAVLVEAKVIDGSYPSLAELEDGIGRLEASGLVKVVRSGGFRATLRGLRVLRAGGLASGALPRPGSDRRVHDALRRVGCRAGRVAIGREAYERGLKRAVGL